MQTSQNTTKTPALIAGNLVGAGALAALNPLLPYSSNPVYEWTGSFVTMLLIAACIYGIYALAFRQRAKAGWPKSYFYLVWFLAGASVLGPYIEKGQNKKMSASSLNSDWGRGDKPASSSVSESWGAGDKEVKETPQAFEFDPTTAPLDQYQFPQAAAQVEARTGAVASGSTSEFKQTHGVLVKSAPPTLEAAKQWTQQSSQSADAGPWLQYAEPGSRFCRIADGTIFTVFPPGVRPHAEKANPFCASTSVSSPEEL